MKWKPTRRNPRLEDRRGQGGGGGGFGLPGGSGGGMGLPIPTGGKGGLGIGTIIIIVVLFFVLRSCGDGGGGFNVPGLPSDQSQIPPSQDTSAPPPEGGEAQDQGREFVNFVLSDLDGFWTEQFQSSGKQLSPRGLVLFTNAVASGCGQASSATGPFYCPLDQKAYVDLTFFNELDKRFKAPGRLRPGLRARARVRAPHPAAARDRARRCATQSQTNPDDANELSVRARAAGRLLRRPLGARSPGGHPEDGDLEEGITAAEAVGDDRIQEQTQGRIDPETLHARHLRAAPHLVPQGLRHRRHRAVRHVRR